MVLRPAVRDLKLSRWSPTARSEYLLLFFSYGSFARDMRLQILHDTVLFFCKGCVLAWVDLNLP
jgi:ABC-type molybdate transport system permease subunit